MSLSARQRDAIEAWVRPLWVETDGVDAFGVVGRRRELMETLWDGEPVNADYSELLLLFHDTVSRIGSTDPGGRWWLFLRSQGIDESQLLRLRDGLGRWRHHPSGLEESALHDAALLEEVGVWAVAQRLWAAGRKRVPLDRAVSRLDAGPVTERFKTALGRRLATERRHPAEEWIATLAADVTGVSGLR